MFRNHISDGEAEIETDPNRSTYVDEYVMRWDRLDYTKQETQESTYNFDAWAYHSEYSLHMYGWYATGWAHDNPSSHLFDVADKFYRANVTPHVMDERFIGKLGTIIWGIFGL